MTDDIIDGTPKPREIFLALSRAGYALPDAVAEYVDNAIDQARNNMTGKGVENIVEIRNITEGRDSIIEISDNCGGCPKKDAVRFIRPGLSGVDPDEGSISRFGIGGKAAGLAVSSLVEVISRAPSENGWKIQLDRNEIMNKEDWNFKIDSLSNLNNIPPETTKIRLHIKDIEQFGAFSINGKIILENRYGLDDLSKGVILKLNGQEIKKRDPEVEILNDLEAPEFCKPRLYDSNFRVPVESNKDHTPRTINVRVKLGLLTEGSRINKFGMNIYCNGRLLVNDSKLGFYDLLKGEDKIGHAGSQLIWIRGIVYLKGPAEAMPWTNRKNDLDPSSPTYRKLEGILKEKKDEFLEDMKKAKEHLKTRTGIKGIPDIRDVIVDHYTLQLKKDSRFELHVRDIVKNSLPFKDAQKKLSTREEDTDNGSNTHPPVHPNTTYLAGWVDTQKVENARNKIERQYGKSNVKNTDVIREILNHFLSSEVS